MLSPRRYRRPLLPQDREVIRLLGITADEYRWFLAEADRLTRLELARPGPKAFIIGPIALAVIQIVVGVALSVAAALLVPRAPQQNRDAPRAENKDVDGQSLIRGDRFSPKDGFDSVQNVVELGSIVPLVYACREIIEGVSYGGIRINTSMLWSQLLSLGGGQMFRGIFLLGQGGIIEIDPQQLAVGDNLLTGYGLGVGGDITSKISIYSRLQGGRLVSSDYVGGRPPGEDDANFERRGAADIYHVYDSANALVPWASATGQPSTQTSFGLYAPIGSALIYRSNPASRPARSPFFKSRNEGKEYQVECTFDGQTMAERLKWKAAFHGRVFFEGFAAGNHQVSAGTVIRMVLANSSDGDRKFTWERIQSGPDVFGEASLADCGQAISGRQKTYDDNISVGDQYLIGSAIALCIDRTNNAFVSNADNEPFGGGSRVVAEFKILRAGTISSYPAWSQNDETTPVTGPILNATLAAQTFKVAIASVTLGRRAQVIEVGIRSTLGISINGLCNFSTSWTWERVDSEACTRYDNNIYDSDYALPTQRFQSGSLSLGEERYSFWKIRYRPAGTSDDFTELSLLYGARSSTRQPVYNYIRMAFPSEADWEFQFQPVSGWEVRSFPRGLYIIDHRLPEISVFDGGLNLTFNGSRVARSERTFRIKLFNTTDNIGINRDLSSNVDAWGKLAELFIYDEVNSSVESGPEHEIVYINIFSRQEDAPQYDDLAILGLSLRAGPEVRRLSQVSAYILRGLQGTHHFPEIYLDLLTNPAYSSRGLLRPTQIALGSFAEATEWTRQRRYFCDIAISEPVNRRTWGQEMAPNFLLDLVTKNGRLFLQPSFYLDRSEPITALFTAGNIIEDSFEVSTADISERQPIRVSVRWRQERISENEGQRGLFPTVREIRVAPLGTPPDARIERIDLSNFCTSQRHAIDVGKYRSLIPLLQRRACRFRTWPQAGAIVPGRCFKTGLETVSYDAPATGAISVDGKVTSWPPLPDGTYEVLLWTSGASEVEETRITIRGGTSSPARSVFCVKRTTSEILTWKASRISLNEEAEVEVEAVEFPVDENDVSLFANGFDDDSKWEIEGWVYDGSGDFVGGITPPPDDGDGTFPPGVEMTFDPIRLNFGQQLDIRYADAGSATATIYDTSVQWVAPAEANAALIWWQYTSTVSHNGAGVLTPDSMPSLRCYIGLELALANATFGGGVTSAFNPTDFNYTVTYNSSTEANRYQNEEGNKFDTILFNPGSTITFRTILRRYAVAYLRLRTFPGRLMIYPVKLNAAAFAAMQAKVPDNPDFPQDATPAQVREGLQHLGRSFARELIRHAVTAKALDAAGASRYDDIIRDAIALNKEADPEPGHVFDEVKRMNSLLPATDPLLLV